MDDSKLLHESNLAARQPQGATKRQTGITSEGLARGPYVEARGGVEPAIFRTEGTRHHHSTNHASIWHYRIQFPLTLATSAGPGDKSVWHRQTAFELPE